MTNPDQLSRRERQIMHILYRLGQASVKDVMENMEDAPGYSSVRTLLGKLVEKGHVEHRESGLKYVYHPVVTREKASRSALGTVVQTFFDDSPYLAVNSLLDMSMHELSDEELDELNRMIQSRVNRQSTPDDR
jgi:predicted transcriptional regulator